MKKYKIAPILLAGSLFIPAFAGCSQLKNKPITFQDCSTYVCIKENKNFCSLHVGTTKSQTLCGLRHTYGYGLADITPHTYDINNPKTMIFNAEWSYYEKKPDASVYTEICEKCKNLIPEDATELRLD